MNVERCDFITTVLFEYPYQHHQDPTEKTQSGIGVGYVFFHASLYEAIIGLEKNLDKRDVGHNPRGKAKGSCQDFWGPRVEQKNQDIGFLGALVDERLNPRGDWFSWQTCSNTGVFSPGG